MVNKFKFTSDSINFDYADGNFTLDYYGKVITGSKRGNTLNYDSGADLELIMCVSDFLDVFDYLPAYEHIDAFEVIFEDYLS